MAPMKDLWGERDLGGSHGGWGTMKKTEYAIQRGLGNGKFI